MYSNVTKCMTLLLCAFLSSSAMAKDVKTTTQPAGLWKPLCFVENKGQVLDENSHPRKDVQFKLATPGMSLFVGNGQLHYQFNKSDKATQRSVGASTYRMDVSLAGANPNATVVASDEQEYTENYYLAQLGPTGITAHSFNKITYKDVYPGIDWVLYIKDSKVEYDFVVRPGGNARDIKLEYDGASALSVLKDGSLFAKTPMGDITAHVPFAYETATGRAVASGFQLKGKTVSFSTGAYTGSLTIDPYLLWSTYFGGTAEDVAVSVVETTGGSTFVGGYSASTTYVLTGGLHTHYLGGTYDAFLAKYNAATGAMVFATYFGGTNNDQGTAIAIDNSGGGNPAVYLAGYTSSNTLIGAAPVKAFAGAVDGFLAKFSNAGGLTWSTYYGGTGDDYIYAVTCDAANNVYIAGQTASAAGIASAGAHQTSLSGPSDAFVAKLSGTAGSITWSTYYGGSAQEQAMGLVCDPSDNVYVTGQTNSIIAIATTGAYQTTLSGVNDAFIAAFTTGGVLSWGTYFGGSGSEIGNGIAYDAVNGKLAIVGNTTSASGVATANAYQQVYGGSQDAFLTYFNTNGTVSWATYYGGNAAEYGQGVCFDSHGNAIITGGTFSTAGIASPTGTFGSTAYQSTIGGNYDAFVAKLNPLGQDLWGSYFGGTLYDYANGVTCNAASQITIAGFTSSTGLYFAGGLATAGAAQTANGGGTYDAFVSKFKSDTLVTVPQPYTDTLVCAGSAFSMPYTANYAFQAGNVFSVQLSDITGSFGAPVTIGSIAAVAATGTIPCTIPAGTTIGSGYRVRITSTLPVYISPDDYYNIHVVSSIGTTTATATTPSCVGNTIYFNDISSYTVSGYSWTGPGFTLPATTQAATVYPATLASQGIYSVVTTHNGCPTTTATVSVSVNDSYPPMPSDSTAAINCVGKNIYLFATPDTTATVTYSWSGPDGFTSTLQNATITGATTLNSGVYTLTDTLAGCPSAANTFTITVLPTTAVAVSISATPGDTICAGTMVSFTAVPTNGGAIPHYQWMSGVSTPIVGAMSNTFASSTLLNGETIFCELTSSLDCPSPDVASSNVITMNVIDNPPIVAIYASTGNIVPPGTTVTFTSAVYDAGTSPIYQWQLNGVNIAGATTPTLTVTTSNTNDTISLMVTSTMSCAIPNYDVNSLVIIPTTGVANVSSPFDNVTLFPNPNAGSFTIKGNVQDINAGSISFEVINPLGQLVANGQAGVNNNVVDKAIDLSNAADGTYLIKLQAGADSKIFRFTVMH